MEYTFKLSRFVNQYINNLCINMKLLNYKINAVLQMMYCSAMDMQYNNRFLDSNNSFPFENQIPNDFADDVKM